MAGIQSTFIGAEEADGSAVRIQAHSQHYSLRWHNHQGHLLHYFDSLQQGERLVDVTLACDDSTVRAHKVVLSACSPYLQRLLADNPCKHPMVILQGISGWQLQALVSFMYRGEISVPQECIASLIKVAETLKVRGLSKVESITCNNYANSASPPSSGSPLFASGGGATGLSGGSLLMPASLMDAAECGLPPAAKIPHLGVGGVGPLMHGLFPYDARTSPLARRKQARPRRRSGDSQSLSESTKTPPSPTQDAPEDLSLKKSPLPDSSAKSSRDEGDGDSRDTTPLPTVTPPASVKSEPLHALSDSLLKNETSVPFQPPIPHLHPAQQDRRKGQHSAPRGGPPRAWTNADLTEALHHVWNRKMTTSQASRVFGIPYNSLLMYVRGKYGKSLKLDTLRKETLEGEAMALAASTRGSYKLAATSATPPGGSKLSSPVAASNLSSSSNSSGGESKAKSSLAASPFALANYGAVGEESHPALAGLGLGGLGGLAAGINPYLSYFCDFSFPVPMMGLVPPPPPPAGAKQQRTPTPGPELKNSDADKDSSCSGTDPEEETNNNNPSSSSSSSTAKKMKTKVEQVEVEEEEEEEAEDETPMLRINHGLITPSVDLSQTGQV